jgi:outer membrane protein OmpA-like peptidoglycan-associated protein
VSGLTGENIQRTLIAVDAALPLLVAGATRKASTPTGASELLGLINRCGTDPAQLANMGKLLSGNNLGSLTSAGTNILTGLFGDRSSGLADSLSGLAGIRPGSATTLLSTLAPLALGLLRGHASREGLGATGLSRLLLGQRDALAHRVPEGLVTPLGWGAPSTWFGSGTRAQAAPAVAPQPGQRRLHWIIAAVVALGLLFFLTRCGKETGAVPTVEPAGAPAGPAATIPDQVKLYFGADSDAPGADASPQLDAIVAYARAHPSARVSVSGYDDPGGKNRALAIRNILVGRGVSEDNVDMNKSIVAPEAAEEREARRVEVSVR